MNSLLLLLLLTVFIVGAASDLASYSTNTCSHAFFSKSKAFFAPPTSNRCIWRITVSPREKILLNITNLAIPKAPNCTRGHIEIRDGYWHDSPLLGKFCGESRLNPIISTTNKMLISYINDNASGGFNATYESICGEALFVEDEANFSSPNYPDLYPNKEKCYWTIAVPDDRRVALTFQDFDVEFGTDCSYDYVEIKDGPVRTFCNQRRPPSPFVANSSFVLVKFVSDFSVQKRGFLVLVQGVGGGCSTTNHGCAQECRNTATGYVCACRSGYYLYSNGKDCVEITNYECGGNRTLSSTGVKYTITSPLYPSPYPLNTTCLWNLFTPMHERRIRLTFKSFDLEEGIRPDRNSNSTACYKDSLRVFSPLPYDVLLTPISICFGNKTADRVQNLGYYCGRTTPEPVLSPGNNLSIVFNSDSSVRGGGFLLEYESELQGCMINNGNCFHRCNDSHGNASCVCDRGATLQSNNRDCLVGDCIFEIGSLAGSISSPNYPNLYPGNKECSWAFKTTPGHRLNITFVDFSTEGAINCLNADYVKLYDNSDFRVGPPVLGLFCGNLSQFQVNSSSNGLYVQFRSFNMIRSRGFRAHYSTICGGNLTADSSERYIYSHPNFGYANYDNDVDCEWTIKAQNKTIILSFLTFSLEGTSCNWDYVDIFEKSSSGLLTRSGRYCWVNKPPPTCSASDTVVVRFRTDHSVTSDGFSLVYRAV